MICCHSVVSDSATPWTIACQASLSFTISWNLLKCMSIQSVMPSNHLILCHPTLLLPSICSSIRVFFNELTLHVSWPKYWSFSFSISPTNEYSGLISFRIDWFDLLAFQGTLKSLLQHHWWKASILWRSAFLTVQLSHPYTTNGKTITLNIQTFVSKGVITLLICYVHSFLFVFNFRVFKILFYLIWLFKYVRHFHSSEVTHPQRSLTSTLIPSTLLLTHSL